MHRIVARVALFGGLVGAGCGTEAGGTGTVVVSVSGEEAARTGFPVEDDGERIEFADGWSVTFSKVLVSLANVSVDGSDGARGAGPAGAWLVDLHRGAPELTRLDGLAARRWDRFSYEVVPPTPASTLLPGVQAADAEAMVASGHTHRIEGQATKAGRTVTFSWAFAEPSRNADCTNGDDSRQGLVVAASSSVRAELTLHLDHLFWTAIGAEGASMRFDPIAAVADAAGRVTWDDLARQGLSPRDAQGAPFLDGDGKALVYDPGTARLPEDNLRGFVQTAFRFAGHLNGGGLCTITKK
jgi:hypothetical protein